MTRTSNRVQTLEDAAEDLNRLLTTSTVGNETRTMLAHALVRLEDAKTGFPKAASYDGSGIRSTSGMTPVERNVFVEPPETGSDEEAGHGPVWVTDPTEADQREVDRILKRIRTDADKLIRFAVKWGPKAPTTKDRTLTATNHREPMCAHCSQWVSDKEPVHRTSDCNGNLPAPTPLGRWCYDFVNRNNRLPSQNECERHDRGQVVRIPA